MLLSSISGAESLPPAEFFETGPVLRKKSAKSYGREARTIVFRFGGLKFGGVSPDGKTVILHRREPRGGFGTLVGFVQQLEPSKITTAGLLSRLASRLRKEKLDELTAANVPFLIPFSESRAPDDELQDPAVAQAAFVCLETVPVDKSAAEVLETYCHQASRSGSSCWTSSAASSTSADSENDDEDDDDGDDDDDTDGFKDNDDEFKDKEKDEFKDKEKDEFKDKEKDEVTDADPTTPKRNSRPAAPSSDRFGRHDAETNPPKADSARKSQPPPAPTTPSFATPSGRKATAPRTSARKAAAPATKPSGPPASEPADARRFESGAMASENQLPYESDLASGSNVVTVKCRACSAPVQLSRFDTDESRVAAQFCGRCGTRVTINLPPPSPATPREPERAVSLRSTPASSKKKVAEPAEQEPEPVRVLRQIQARKAKKSVAGGAPPADVDPTARPADAVSVTLTPAAAANDDSSDSAHALDQDEDGALAHKKEIMGTPKTGRHAAAATSSRSGRATPAPRFSKKQMPEAQPPPLPSVASSGFQVPPARTPVLKAAVPAMQPVPSDASEKSDAIAADALAAVLASDGSGAAGETTSGKAAPTPKQLGGSGSGKATIDQQATGDEEHAYTQVASCSSCFTAVLPRADGRPSLFCSGCGTRLTIALPSPSAATPTPQATPAAVAPGRAAGKAPTEPPAAVDAASASEPPVDTSSPPPGPAVAPAVACVGAAADAASPNVANEAPRETVGSSFLYDKVVTVQGTPTLESLMSNPTTLFIPSGLMPLAHFNDINFYRGGELGAGAYGIVRAARWRGHEIAVKVITAADQLTAALVSRELAALDVLRGAPDTVHLLAVCLQPNRVLLLMECLRDYVTIFEHIATLHGAGSPLPVQARQELMTIIQLAFRGLAEHHRRRVIHRDIKPENAMVRVRNGVVSVKFIDFGLARPPTLEPYSTDLRGTSAYVAPETWRDRLVSDKSDVYAMGVLGWQLVAGGNPYDAAQRDDLLKFSELVADGTLRPSLAFVRFRHGGQVKPDPDLQALFRRLWHAEPSQRPTALEAMEAVGKLLNR